MGFSIGSFLSSVGKVLLPAFGTAIAGPIGGIIGAGISSAFTRTPQPSFPSQVGPTALPVVDRLLRRIPGAIFGAGARRFSAAQRRRAVLLARELGIAGAAAALGITAIELADILVSSSRRRRRGITARQITTTKATLRRMDSLNRQIAKACPPPARRSRRTVHHAVHH